jgi:hypothetical protein
VCCFGSCPSYADVYLLDVVVGHLGRFILDLCNESMAMQRYIPFSCMIERISARSGMRNKTKFFCVSREIDT